jgi:sigma-E factor negative regulatory protein RseB
MSCYKRPGASPIEGAIHWIFSDGLASVSLFLEPYDRQRHQQEGVFAAGATQTLTRRWTTGG